jgi:ABC-type bacteriocin/lantibiotic exporter with double-glycine peptidase domain
MDKTDDRTSHYLHARQGHFRILMVQYYSFVGFKTLITGLLLVLGCVLLISKEINLGQFVASEIIIITIINAVEKVLIKLDVVYDVLTSAEKIGVVTDLPTEPTHGLAFEDLPVQPGISVRLSNLRYRYPNEKEYTLKDIDLTLAPGEKICLSGPGGSGKTTLLRIILGLFPSYEGVITYNNVSLRDLNKPSLLRHIGEDCVPQSLFEGTVLENITMGQTSISVEDVLRALDDVGLNEFVQTLPQGVHTLLIGRGEQLPFSAIRKLTLARSLAKKPQLLLLDDFLPELGGREKEAILQRIMQRFESATIVIVSNDPMVMRTCHRVLEIRDGELLPEKHPSDSNSLAG